MTGPPDCRRTIGLPCRTCPLSRCNKEPMIRITLHGAFDHLMFALSILTLLAAPAIAYRFGRKAGIEDTDDAWREFTEYGAVDDKLEAAAERRALEHAARRKACYPHPNREPLPDAPAFDPAKHRRERCLDCGSYIITFLEPSEPIA